MQRPDLKLVEQRKKPNGSGSSEWLDAWLWAERISVIGLFTLAVGYTLFVVQELFVPVVTAWVMGAILRPVVESGEKHGVPRVVGVIATAMVALLMLLAIIGLLSTPLAYWIGRTAELAQLIKGKLQLLNQPLAVFDEIASALSGSSRWRPRIHVDRALRYFNDHQRSRIDPCSSHNPIPTLLFCDDFLDALRERNQRRPCSPLRWQEGAPDGADGLG
jgi:hypothetical protein